MSTQFPPLPYRRLKMMANGIWDEVRKVFYPFKLANSTVAAKAGIRYYIKNVSTSGANAGDTSVATPGWTFKVDGNTLTTLTVVPATVAASNVNSGAQFSMDVNVLCDTNSAITTYGGPTTVTRNVIYAEIPEDLGWVVVE